MAFSRLSILLAVTLGFSATQSWAYTFDDLKKEIESKNLQSIETVIPTLPADYLQEYVLAYDSRSRQQASPSHPRAILFGSDAKFIVAFNGDPDLSGNNELETIQFNSKEKKFEFRAIEFREGQPPVISELNPMRCQHCHGENLRPIWEAYPLWPGFYGAEKSSIFFPRNMGPFPKERALYQTYLDIKDAHPRYKFLRRLIEFTTPQDGDPYNQDLEAGEYLGKLNRYLHRLNDEKNLNDVYATPALKRLRFAILGAIRCNNIAAEEFLPAAMRTNLTPFAQVVSETRASLGATMKMRFDRHASLLGGISTRDDLEADEVREHLNLFEVNNGVWTAPLTTPPPDFNLLYTEATSRLKYILNAAHVDLADWNLHIFMGKSLDFQNTISDLIGFFAFRRLLTQKLYLDKEGLYGPTDTDQGIAPYKESLVGPGPECDALKARSLQELAEH